MNKIFFICILISALFPTIKASAGGLDPSFGTNGTVATSLNFDHQGNDIALQADGKIIMVGQAYNSQNSGFGVVRYLPNGSLDTTFNGDGKAFTVIGLGSGARTVIVQPDNKIVVVGEAAFSTFGFDFGIARYNPDGSLDTTFDGDGLARAFLQDSPTPTSAALQPDGKIVVAGYVPNFGATILVRFNPDGSLDTTFDGDGRLTTLPDCTFCFFFDAQTQPDGKIVAVGFDYLEQTGGRAGLIARFKTDGSLDPGFDADGVKILNFGYSSTSINSVAFQNDGKIVASGLLNSNPIPTMFVSRYNPDGSLDTTFDTDGIASVFFPSARGDHGKIAVQTNGKIVIAGGYSDFFVARFEADGQLDADLWGTGGLVATDFGGAIDDCNAVVIQPDGKVVAAGTTFFGGPGTFALARYFGDPATTAAGVSISGRVVDASGHGISQTNVLLTDTDGRTRSTRSNSFGFYKFEEVATGQTYIVSVNYKKYVFSPDMQVLNVSEAIENVDFTAGE